MFEKHAYKHLDKKENSINSYAIDNPCIELNMEDIARMVFNTNYGLQRFVSYYDDLAKESGSKWKIEQSEALIESMEKCE